MKNVCKYQVLFLLLLSKQLIAQSYFETSLGNSYVQNGVFIVENNNSYIVSGEGLENNLATHWDSYLFNIGLEGSLNNLHTYTSSNANYSEFAIRGLRVENTQFVATGWFNYSNEQHSISLFFRSDSAGNIIDTVSVGNIQDANHCNQMCLGNEGGYFLAGGLFKTSDTKRRPYLIQLNANGEAVRDTFYEQYKSAYGDFQDIQQCVDGSGYYVLGSLNPGIFSGGALLIKIDEEGTILQEFRYSDDGGENPGAYVKTFIQDPTDGSIVIPYAFKDGSFINYGGAVKVAADLSTIIWDTPPHSFCEGVGPTCAVLAPDGNYVLAGLQAQAYGAPTDVEICKLSAIDGSVLWKRAYGGSGNDYAYDLINTQDGGFMVCGRTESSSKPTAWVYSPNPKPTSPHKWTPQPLPPPFKTYPNLCTPTA
jgi:hypothetical protein